MDPAVRAGMNKAGLPGARWHLLVCAGPDCCAAASGEALWDHVKRRVRETGLPAMRTKTLCLRICAGGPWLVVYPDGIWYGAMTPERFDRILEEHLRGGRPVTAWVEARNPLAGDAPGLAPLG